MQRDVVIVTGGYVLVGGESKARFTLSDIGALGVYRGHAASSLIGTISHDAGESFCAMLDGVNNGDLYHAAHGKRLYDATLVLICREAPADVAAGLNVGAFEYLRRLGADVMDYREASFAANFGSLKIRFPGVHHGSLVKELPILSQEVFCEQVLGTFEGEGSSIAKLMLINFRLADERMKPRYCQRLAQLRKFAPQTAALCELLATKGHWAVQLRTKVRESNNPPQHQDGEVPLRTTYNPRFELHEPGVT